MNTDITPSDKQSVGALIGRPLENVRYELFAQRIAAGASISDAYRDAGYEGSRGSLGAHGSRLAADPQVQARVGELCRAAAATAVFDVRSRMLALQETADADPSELGELITGPCPDCWGADPDQALAAAYDAHVEAISRGEAPSPPSLDDPRQGCKPCRGRGIQRLDLTDTNRLSARARRLIKGFKKKVDGSIELVLVDQLAASAQLASLAGWVIDKSLNLNANVPTESLPPATPSSVLDAFRALQAAKGAT